MFASNAPRRGALPLCLALALCAAPSPALGESEPEKTGDETATAPKVKITADWYGYVKLDASWDDSIIDSGNFARWASSPSVVEDHEHFNVTARQTRFGVDLRRESRDSPPISARIEIDFYGGGAENKNRPQLRHAYFDILWPAYGWRLRAGQTSDVISPLVPSTLNYTVAWWVGNIGYRRPMVQATRTIDGEKGGQTRVTAALSRTIGDDFGTLEPGDSGVDSGMPTIQAALSYSFPETDGRGPRLGVSAHWGREQLEEKLGQAVPEFDSWSANLDFLFPLGKSSTVKGELWRGENLDDYFGGIGQGIDFGRELEIEARGGWLACDLTAGPRTTASLGLGIDDPEDEALPSGARSRNQSVWANLVWDFRPALRFGVEGSWWQTDYVGLEDGSSFRLQTSLIFTFRK